MFELVVEFMFLILVVGFVIAVSGSSRVRSALLTIFGTLGFGLLALGLVLFVGFNRRELKSEFAHFEVPGSGMFQIHLDSSEVLPVSHQAETKSPPPKTVVARKPAIAAESTPIEELPVRAAEPIRIDEQTRAEIEQQWREGELHDRLRYTGTGAAALLSLLATMFGYLKLDMLSQAKYRRGLQAGAAGVILTVALVAALAAEGRLGF
jgi:hypothetical protein